VLGAGLDWRQVDLVRAYLAYFRQIQGTLALPFVRGVLLENPLAVRLLVRLHEARFDPALDARERERREAWLNEAFASYRDRVLALNEDRALSGLHDLVQATLRSDFFLTGREPHRITLKLDPGAVAELAGPQPYREIFVHSAEMMGIHLRGGAVARGGLRFSDRADDLRVEVRGLMRTQMLKNGLIVPVGAKGGFVLQGGGRSPRETRRLADVHYRVFVESLLAITDDVAADGRVIAPAGVERRDGDDPYLVVAADKGTAHLSDAANEVSRQRGFWLGDAFASGGTEGYDHKKLAITARGAWECVKHHFAELGIDPERDAFSVAGIGDMSGDVFGNGMLLARRARLIAAFDHRHVFLDPDPDPALAWQERARLFALPGSSWEDYDPCRMSAGGGVFPRGAKRIELSEAAREHLGIEASHASGNEVVRAILAMPVDLLWNGGIGTYVKASGESHVEVGDRANDAVRIDARELRARVVGEGGNLGLTQPARVEAALAGVRLNTDAIDNSAGVDLSDHEVNSKILFAPLLRSGRLSARERRAALLSAAESACRSVLAHNRSQALAISLDERRSREDLEPFARAIDALCGPEDVDRAELGLPDAEVLERRAAEGAGLTRPELAVLLGMAKLQTRQALAASPLVESAYWVPRYESYFPEAFRVAHSEAIRRHRLRGEITALVVTSRAVDAGGVTLVPSLAAELGISAPEVLAAVQLAEDVLEAERHRDALIAAGPRMPRESLYAALLEIDRGVRGVARFLVRSGEAQLDASRVASWHEGLRELSGTLVAVLAREEADATELRRTSLVENGVPAALAAEIAALPLADRGLNVLRIAVASGLAPATAARVYGRLGEGTGILWVKRRLAAVEARDPWDRLTLADLRYELLDLQRELTQAILAEKPDDPDEAVDAFVEANAALLDRIRGLVQRAGEGASVGALSVLTARLRELRPRDSTRES
jgi:glutamate dehydrogenase